MERKQSVSYVHIGNNLYSISMTSWLEDENGVKGDMKSFAEVNKTLAEVKKLIIDFE